MITIETLPDGKKLYKLAIFGTTYEKIAIDELEFKDWLAQRIQNKKGTQLNMIREYLQANP